MSKKRQFQLDSEIIFGGFIVGAFLLISVIFIKAISIKYFLLTPDNTDNLLITPFATATTTDPFINDSEAVSLPGVFELEMIVFVSGTGSDGLRMRKNAGITEEILNLAGEGETLKIIDGPKIIDNQIWWGLVSLDNPIKSGWSVQDFLEPSN